MSKEQALEKFNPNSLAAIIGEDDVAAINDQFGGGIASSTFLPEVRLRGREFRLKIGGEETTLPEKHLDVFMVTARPTLSKVFYKDSWGGADSAGAPDCSSADAIQPDSNAKEPQHSNCQLCPHNAWGSKISNTGSKGKACQDYKLIVVVLPQLIDTPFALRIPAATLKIYQAYLAKLKMAGAPANAALTRLTFTDAEYPQLDFTFIGTVESREQYQALKDVAESAEVLEAIKIQPRTAPAPVEHTAEQPVVVVPEPVVEEPAEEAAPDLASLLAKNKTETKAKRTSKKKEAAEEAPAAPAEPAEPAIKGLDDLLASMKKK